MKHGLLIVLLALLPHGMAQAQPAEPPLPSEAEILQLMARYEAELQAQAGTEAETARAGFERRLNLAEGYLLRSRPADARRHWDAIRRLAPDNADGRGRIARAALAEVKAAVDAGQYPADVPALAARIAAPCRDGESRIDDVRAVAFGLESLTFRWAGLADGDRLALYDASVGCHVLVSARELGDFARIDELARLRLAVDRPDDDYRAILPALRRQIEFNHGNDDYGFRAESGRSATDDLAARYTGLYLDTLWRLETGQRPDASRGERRSVYGFNYDGPILLAQALDDTPANAALRRRAARRMAQHQRNETAVALIDEQAQLIAEHRLGRLRRAAQVERLGYDASLAGLISPSVPDRVYEITRELGDLADIMQLRNYGVGTVRDLIRPDEAVLLVVPTPSGTHSFLIRSASQELWSRSALTRDDVHRLARQVRFHTGAEVEPSFEELASWGEEGFSRTAAHRLYTELVAPFAAEIAALDHLIVIAGGPLEGLPFSLLVTEAPSGNNFSPQALRETRWFADVVPMSRVPTLQSFLLLRRERRDRALFGDDGERRAGRGFLALADPSLSGPDVVCSAEALRGGALTRAMPRDFAASDSLADSLRRLPRLPCTAPEAATVGSAVSGRRTILTRADNVETSFHAAGPAAAAVLLFATHAVMPGEIPGVIEPSLVLTPPATSLAADATATNGAFVVDGLLSASEIAQMSLSPDWIILSACNSGQGLARLGQRSAGGIVPYFFAAGAQRILATNWPLLDSSAADITTRAIRASARGRMGGARALQQAMIAVRNDASRDANPAASLAHPMVWAAFELHGDGGMPPRGARW